MSKKKKIFIIIIAAVVVLLLLFFFWLLWSKKIVVIKKTSPVTTSQTSVSSAARETDDQTTAILSEETATVQSGLESLSRAFAERYGSFSSDSEKANLRDVLDFMSGGLRSQTEKYLDSTKPSADYYGVTTRVLSVEVIALDDLGGTAKISVATQRTESKGSPQNMTIVYQTLSLDYVKEGDLWKVTSAVWQ